MCATTQEYSGLIDYQSIPSFTKPKMSGSPSSDEPESVLAFRRWAQQNGGYIHEALCFQTSAFQLEPPHRRFRTRLENNALIFPVRTEPTRSVIAGKAIPTNTCILSCPFDLAITTDLAFGAVKACVWDASQEPDSTAPPSLPSRIDRLNERQIVCAYIGLHWIVTDEEKKRRVICRKS